MRETGDDAGAEKILAAKAEAGSGVSGERTRFASFSGREPFTIIALAFLFAMVLLLAGSRLFGRRIEAGGGPMLRSVRAAIDISRRRDAPRRLPGSPESEPKAPLLTGADATTDGQPIAQSAEGSAVFKREGEFWTIAYRATTFRVRDIKGLAYIAYLLAHPGERFHVRELIAQVEGTADTASTIAAEVAREGATTHDLGDAGAALDQHAQVDYRRRLRELAEELAEAERLNDIGRAESLKAEQEFLSGELLASTGIGGRDRKAVAHVERARTLVRKNIRAGVEKIRNEDAALGRYFADSIQTGYYCAYLPDPERKISWRF
jgi:non-specific serine/threonine protein kinase